MANGKKENQEGKESTLLFSAQDPIELFQEWLREAQEAEAVNPDAMSLATVDAHGFPNVRMVLLKGVNSDGFVFYTNTESAKAADLATSPRAALCFYWKSLRRQVRVKGGVSSVSELEADEYFASRSKDAQIGAWASKQSKALEGRFELEAQVAKYAAKFALRTVERPPFWSGYRVQPTEIEFWRERKFRLHDRRVFVRQPGAQLTWKVQQLYP